MRNVWLAAFSDLPAPIDGVNMERDIEQVCAFWERIFTERLYEPVDLVLLPEASSRPRNTPASRTGPFTDAVYERLLEVMCRLARRHNCYIAYPSSTPPDQDGNRRNRIHLIDREGKVCAQYDKIGLTSGELGARRMLPGESIITFDCDFGRVGFFTCFDINFPELMFAYRKTNPDLMLYASMCDGAFMRSQWAYTCRCHLLSAVGGHLSTLLDPAGSTIAQSTNYRSYLRAQVNLDCENIGIGLTWEQLHEAQRRYPGKFYVEIPPYLSTGVAYSRDEERDVYSFLREFQIPTLDEYYDAMREEYRQRGVWPYPEL